VSVMLHVVKSTRASNVDTSGFWFTPNRSTTTTLAIPK
jgi:hypothetical protein